MEKTILINEEMAHVIMGALAVCDSEGISGIEMELKHSSKIWADVEFAIIRQIYVNFPDVVKRYSFIKYIGLTSELEELDNA